MILDLKKKEQIDICQPGNSLCIQNAKSIMLKGFIRLMVDRWGKIKIADEPFYFSANTNLNISEIEYEQIDDLYKKEYVYYKWEKRVFMLFIISKNGGKKKI